MPNLEPGVRTLFQSCQNQHITTRKQEVEMFGDGGRERERDEREGGTEEGEREGESETIQIDG